METIRAFIAIELPSAVQDRLAALQRQLRDEVPPGSVRWVRPTGVHLTLKFLGDTRVEALPEIHQALTVVARHTPACTFTVGGLGCFPNPLRPRVVWVGLQEETGRLAALRAAIEEATAPLGYERERRSFRPHLTLGRVQRRASRTEAAEIGQVVARTAVDTLGGVAADRFALIRSVLRPQGAEYSTLEIFRLREVE